MKTSNSLIFGALFALALCAMPLAPAHDTAGVAGYPNLDCEGYNYTVHEYAAAVQPGFHSIEGVVPAFVISPPMDGAELAQRFCAGGTTPQGDGHREFAVGGAYIPSMTGDGVASSDPNVAAGALYCRGEEAHHSSYGPFEVQDTVLGYGVSFAVAVDSVDSTGNGNGCGDGLIDVWAPCGGAESNPCSVTFGPGLDGSYYVFVEGTGGHIIVN